MKTKLAFCISALLLAAVPAACSSTTQSSSSSHWETCESVSACADVAGAVGCSGGYCVDASGDRIARGGGGNGDTCDPYDAPVVSLELAAIVGAAEDTDGTVYVADKSSTGIDRLFVSGGGELARVRVLGTGSGSAGNVEFASYSFERDGATFTLRFETTDGTTHATLVGGIVKQPVPGSGTPRELTLVAEADARSMPVSGWENGVFTEYYAEVESGERIVVVRPEEDWSYEDFRLFYGSSTLREFAVTNVTRARDGGSTHIEFELDGVAADLYFPVDGAPTLTAGGDEKSVTRLEGAPGSDVSYICS